MKPDMIAATALHKNVLIVYVMQGRRDWSAYCLPVEGIDHTTEMYEWKKGTKVSESIARATNPGLCELFDNESIPWRA